MIESVLFGASFSCEQIYSNLPETCSFLDCAYLPEKFQKEHLSQGEVQYSLRHSGTEIWKILKQLATYIKTIIIVFLLNYFPEFRLSLDRQVGVENTATETPPISARYQIHLEQPIRNLSGL